MVYFLKTAQIRELEGQVSDPELDRHICLFCVCNGKKGRILDYFKINAKFWTTGPKLFDFLLLDKRGSSYRG